MQCGNILGAVVGAIGLYESTDYDDIRACGHGSWWSHGRDRYDIDSVVVCRNRWCKGNKDAQMGWSKERLWHKECYPKKEASADVTGDVCGPKEYTQLFII